MSLRGVLRFVRFTCHLREQSTGPTRDAFPPRWRRPEWAPMRPGPKRAPPVGSPPAPHGDHPEGFHLVAGASQNLRDSTAHSSITLVMAAFTVSALSFA